ncbi:OapC/ArvC family zinc-ribbon domain-containing protein [Natronorubrum daqingense]|uniref:Zn-ribbon containing protein n=1 Tax=Natronorubrum daqingense TaxID=588898 RepID=A0A1N7F8J4_9EURY|nr:Zn-ribbon containing protein [Natronorubrum daqingense]APX97609.1 hypothetical protein BB347_13885 [Natronorubrum daqingense]SIR96639.1 hypothetical protein SAMN05421809_3099 [Natronorubrum daqingense]
MPHECTNCGRTFPDGSKEMLSGCPDCGGNKFQFAPSGQATSNSAHSSEASAGATESAGDASSPSSSSPTGTVGRAAKTVRGWVSSESDTADDAPPVSSESPPTTSETPQASSESSPERSPQSSTPSQRDSSQPQPQSWPDEAKPDNPSEESTTEEFTAWPETARRPENRSDAPSDGDRGAPETQGSASATPASSPASSEPSSDGNERTPETNAEPTPTRADGTIVADDEDTAQADARSEVVSSNDLPETDHPSPDTRDGASHPQHANAASSDAQPPSDGRVVSEPTGEQPSIEELRAELNEQFESIKIVSPGQYELNLMELYNREEYIISLQEDGRYVIDVPDSWRNDEDEE